MNDEVRQRLNSVLDAQVLCTVATLGEGGFPNSASVAFSHSDTYEFFFATDDSTRKAQNISRDNRVALTITDSDKRQTMQLEGTAVVVDREEFLQKHAEKHFEKLPFTAAFKNIPTVNFYKVSPLKMKFTDINNRPWRVEEITLPVLER